MNKGIPTLLIAGTLLTGFSGISKAKPLDSVNLIEFDTEECAPILGVQRKVNELLIICSDTIDTFDGKKPIGKGTLSTTGESTAFFGDMLGIKDGATLKDPKNRFSYTNQGGEFTATMTGKIFGRPYSPDEAFLSVQGNIKMVVGNSQHSEILKSHGYRCSSFVDSTKLTIGNRTTYNQKVDSTLCILKESDT